MDLPKRLLKIKDALPQPPLSHHHLANPVFEILQNHITRLQDLDTPGLSDHHEVLHILGKIAGSQEWVIYRALELDWLRDVIEPLKHFISLVEDTVSAHPVLAGFVWGAVRFILTVMPGHSKHFASATGILKDMCSRLVFYRDVDPGVYRNSERVQHALARVLGYLLNFCHEVYRIHHSRGSFKDPWKSANVREVLASFDEAELALRKAVKVESKARTARAVAEKPPRFTAEDERQYIIASQHDGDYSEKVKALKDMMHLIPHANPFASRVNTSDRDLAADWLLRTPQYLNWAALPGPNPSGTVRSADHILIVHGLHANSPASLVLDDLMHQRKRHRVTHKIVVCHHRCLPNDETNMSLEPLHIVGSIFRDLLSHLPIHLQHQCTSLPFDTLSHVEASIRTVSEHFDKVHIIIDGMMECAGMDVDRLVLSVRKLAGGSTVWVGLVDQTMKAARLVKAFRNSAIVDLDEKGGHRGRKLSPAGSAFFEYQSPPASLY